MARGVSRSTSSAAYTLHPAPKPDDTMTSRRRFLQVGALAGVAVPHIVEEAGTRRARRIDQPIVVSTWQHGLAANRVAYEVLRQRGSALDAVEAGVRVSEADPAVTSVGFGGMPDLAGRVTLDACIMNADGECGAVAALQHIKHPISVARRVMEQTPHVMLVGEGALEFALESGFERENLLTPQAERAWREWLEKEGAPAKARINIENHDTIGMLAIDVDGNMSGACTTSGAAWKLPGRVGDSPIIGAGLYVDNDVGAACATGWGEAVIRIVGSHLVVEYMRQGYHPDEACRRAVDRVIRKDPDYEDIQVGFVALSRDGTLGAYAIQSGFDIAIHDAAGPRLIDASSRL